ncbi:MAG: efflux RND transporter periplasmic adaptor subunit [Chlamydiae bacterium]|nr:efflux RND transporter periplasmic adaptor subunit [Chlamydiota bacterium]MBI3265527.1 efflux RND transporter periplasmic adaptor subunit [Chlamydiota bacterium]
MKTRIFIILIVVLGLTSFLLIYRHSVSGRKQDSSEKVESATYYCPMHPTYTSDRPGNCPICNMTLEKREEVQPSPSQSLNSKDICFMHNCPMMKEGETCPMMVVAKVGEKVTCPVCGSHVAQESKQGPEKKILYWTDPMMPDFRSDKPGKSPMGMDWVPVYEEEAVAGGDHAASPSGYTPILVSPQKIQLIGVKTVLAKKQNLTKQIRTVGRVTVDETRIVRVHPKVEGWVEEIFAKYEGDRVNKGQPLFSFYSPDFVSAQEEYLSALKMQSGLPSDVSSDARRDAQANVDSAQKRLQWWDVTDEQIEELRKRQAPQKTLVLTSPIDGVILKKNVFAGQFMERGAGFFELADLSSVWVDADLYEYDLPWVKVGEEGRVTLPNDSKNEWSGKVIYVAPLLKAETRTAVARLELSNADNVLKPEMYVTVEISIDLGERLVVPAEALLDTGERKIVFVSKENGIFEPREVVMGAKTNKSVEIEKGIDEGEVVVINGNFLIDSESRLKAAMEGMGSGEHQH